MVRREACVVGGTCGHSFIWIRVRTGTTKAQDTGQGPDARSKAGSVHVMLLGSSRPFLQAADVIALGREPA